MLSRRVARRVALFAALGALAIQAVPYGHAHANPPVRSEPPWPSAATRQLAARACFDCHSNQTVWPWYSTLAPVSWLVQHDVDEGREKLNFSEWDRPQEAREAPEQVTEGDMPPFYYVALHPAARLDAAEQQSLITGLQTMAGSAPARGDRSREAERRR